MDTSLISERPLVRLPSRRPALSLSVRRPDLAEQWDDAANEGHRLDDFDYRSTYRAWWVCPRQHHWQATIKSRYSKRSGCRRCALATAPRQDQSFLARTLRVRSPEIANTWHPDKNPGLTPDDVTFSSRTRIWWQCPVVPRHVWETTVNNRQRSGCPYCAGRMKPQHYTRVRYTLSLRASHPELSKEWDGSRNGTLTPDLVTAGSKYSAWWQCPIDPTHAWELAVFARTQRNRTCPHCRAKRKERKQEGVRTPYQPSPADEGP